MAGGSAATESTLLRQLIADLPGSSASTAELLGRLGNLAAVISARPEQIAQIAGIAAAERLDSIKALCDYLARSPLSELPLLDGTTALADYLRVTMAGLIVEEVRALYLNVKTCLVRDEIIVQGSVSQASFFPREIIRRALELGAKSIIIAHNHPSGDLQPSNEDKAITQRLRDAASIFDIGLLDHFIVSQNGWFSFRVQGLL